MRQVTCPRVLQLSNSWTSSNRQSRRYLKSSSLVQVTTSWQCLGSPARAPQTASRALRRSMRYGRSRLKSRTICHCASHGSTGNASPSNASWHSRNRPVCDRELKKRSVNSRSHTFSESRCKSPARRRAHPAHCVTVNDQRIISNSRSRFRVRKGCARGAALDGDDAVPSVSYAASAGCVVFT